MDENAAVRAEIRLSESALVLTAIVGIAAKIAGVIVAPGARGVFGQTAVVVVETATGAFAYTLTALLVALVCGASFELARARSVNVVARGGVIGATGLIVALASPAVIERLPPIPTLALALITSLTVVTAGAAVVKASGLRALGGVLMLFAVGGLFRNLAWELASIAFDASNIAMLNAARVLSTIGVGAQAVSVLVAAAWIGTRGSRWKGRVLANAAILVAFVVTWVAARTDESPTTLGSVLRESLPLASAASPTPYLLGAVAAFLVPASILLAVAALIVRGAPTVVVAALALTLLATGAYDVPLNALLATAGAQWALLALMTPQRSGVQQPRSAPAAPLME